MQSEEPRMHIFVARMQYLFNQISRNFMKREYLNSCKIKDISFDANILDLNQVFCGDLFEEYKYKEQISDDDLCEFKKNVIEFHKSICEGLKEKINFDNIVLNFIPNFTPKTVVSGEINSISPLVLNLFSEKEHKNLKLINQEYRLLSDLPEIKKLQNLSISEFWTEVGLIKK